MLFPLRSPCFLTLRNARPKIDKVYPIQNNPQMSDESIPALRIIVDANGTRTVTTSECATLDETTASISLQRPPSPVEIPIPPPELGTRSSPDETDP